MSKTNDDAKHCQICERAIKANTGKIAHHGYTRPGTGWQTASCMGARHLPYEVSCDVIPLAIDQIGSWIATLEKRLEGLVHGVPIPNPDHARWLKAKIEHTYGARAEKLRNSPAPEATIVPGKAPFVRADGSTVTNSDGSVVLYEKTYGYNQTYADIFKGLRHTIAGQISMSKLELDRLEKRLAAWVAPTVEA